MLPGEEDATAGKARRYIDSGGLTAGHAGGRLSVKRVLSTVTVSKAKPDSGRPTMAWKWLVNRIGGSSKVLEVPVSPCEIQWGTSSPDRVRVGLRLPYKERAQRKVIESRWNPCFDESR